MQEYIIRIVSRKTYVILVSLTISLHILQPKNKTVFAVFITITNTSDLPDFSLLPDVCHQRFTRLFAAARRLSPAIYSTFRCCQTSVNSDLLDFSLLSDAWHAAVGRLAAGTSENKMGGNRKSSVSRKISSPSRYVNMGRSLEAFAHMRYVPKTRVVQP